MLRRAGYPVLEVADNKEVVDHIQESRPEVAVVADPEVCRKLAGGFTSLLLILTRDDPGSRVQGLRAGADDVLARPFDAEELKARVDALLRRRTKPVEPAAAVTGDFDVLTGLTGPRSFTLRLGEALQTAAAASEPLSLMAIDLDAFGAVNSRFGRSAGDRLLKACSRAIVRVCRDEDTVARAGGDEFVVLMPRFHFAASLGAAERVWREIAGTTIVEGGARISCATSIGVASYPGKDIETARDLLQLTHAALGRAKAEGRGICLYQHHGYLFHPEVTP